MEFREGGMVVVPGCGVGQIEDIEVVQMDDMTVSMYRIVVEGDVRIWVPTATARLQGIRRPVAEERVQALLDAVRDTTAPTERATWNRRQRRYTEQLMSNDPLQLAELLGEPLAVEVEDRVLGGGEGGEAARRAGEGHQLIRRNPPLRPDRHGHARAYRR